MEAGQVFATLGKSWQLFARLRKTSQALDGCVTPQLHQTALNSGDGHGWQF